jgi:monoamine oxidase
MLQAQPWSGNGTASSVREPFINGGYAEMGAVRIPDVHRFTNKYIDEFLLGDKLFEYNEPGEQLWYLDGKRFTTPKNGQEWPLEKMSADERRDPTARRRPIFVRPLPQRGMYMLLAGRIQNGYGCA